MFGINSFEQVEQIAEGWTNYALGRENELSEQRMKVCIECPLYNKSTDRCDAKKCYNPEKNEMGTTPGNGFICGCNCYMKKATRSINKKCVLNKW